MACPYFFPVERLDEALWAVPPRLPLLHAFRGECHASEAVEIPVDELLRGVCNSGYGRGKCARFPDSARADAVRFHVTENADDVRLQYVLEKECRPVDFGELRYSLASGVFEPTPADRIVAQQATVFIETYMHRVHGGRKAAAASAPVSQS